MRDAWSTIWLNFSVVTEKISDLAKVLNLNYDNYDDRLDLENRRSTELRNLTRHPSYILRIFLMSWHYPGRQYRT